MFCWPWISIYACNETNVMHFIFGLFSHYTSTCFGLASCPSSGGSNVYMQQMVRVVRFSWLSAGLVWMGLSHSNQASWQSTKTGINILFKWSVLQSSSKRKSWTFMQVSVRCLIKKAFRHTPLVPWMHVSIFPKLRKLFRISSAA
jgi:hypothetical protein